MYPEAFGTRVAPKPTGAAPSSLKDLATSFGLGATGSVKALTDVAGADNAASRTLGGISEDLSRAYTPARQAEIERRQQLIKEAEKSGSTWEEIKANLGAVTEAPLQSALQGLGSIVPYAVTGGVGAAAKSNNQHFNGCCARSGCCQRQYLRYGLRKTKRRRCF
jgi:hypothetical protein